MRKLKRSGRWPQLLIASVLLGALAGGACNRYNEERAYQEAADARRTPVFSQCVNGKKLAAMSNCAEVCQSLGRACQNSGCEHPQDKSTRYGGLSFGGSLCLESPDRAFQCYDAFTNDVGVRCCCVKP